MKTIMRRTVAFVLMVCLLLSVFPAVSLIADAASNSITYDFKSGDGQDHTTLTVGDSFHNGAWAFAGANAKNTAVYEKYGIRASMGWSTQYFAVKLNNIPGPGTYDMTFTVPSNCMATATPYILAGNTDASALTATQIKAGTLVGTVNPGDGTNSISTTLSVTIPADKIVEGSVVLVFYANQGATVMFRCESLEMTKTSWTYSLSSGGVNYKQSDSTLSSGQTFQNGTWAFMDSSQNNAVVGSTVTYINLGYSEVRWGAIKLNNIPGPGTYEMTFTVPSNSGANAKVYILSGDTTSFSTNIIKAGTPAIGTIAAYSVSATSTLSVTISASDIVGGSVILGITSPDTGNVAFRANTLEMKVSTPKVAQVGDAQYTSVSEAITAAGANGTVQLITSVEETVTVSNGVTLDLAGNTLTGNVIVSDGNIIDSATDSADATTLGGIVGTVTVETTNTYLPLKDGTTWRFFKYELAAYEAYEDTTEGDVEFWFDIDITNAIGYTLLSTDSSAAGLKITAALSWSGAAEGSVDVVFKTSESDIVAGWAAAELVEETGKEAGMYLSVTGIPADTTVSVVPMLESTAGAKCNFGAAATYPAA